MHSRRHASLRALLLAGAALLAITPAIAADVTPERLANPEPGNWLTNHRTYDAQRYSPLDQINKTNIRNLKLAFAVAIGGTAANENLQSTPLAEDGFLYVTDQWGVLYKIDVRSGDTGRIVWRMDPGQEKVPLANRGAALWGNLVVTVASYPPRVIATNKETGKVVWDTNMSDGQVDVQLTAAPLAVKDKIIVGASGGDRGVRDWIAALDGATGKVAWRNYVIPAPGEPGSETWKDKNNAWRTGGGAMWITGSYDVASGQILWGTGNPIPWSDPYYRPGDNLFTNSLISWDPDSGKMNWYHQYTPGDMWDYDEEGSHVLIDTEGHKLITHAARNGFLYSFERANGQTLMAKPYVPVVNWTQGIDQKTGLPVDYDPKRDIQIYSGKQNQTLAEPTKKLCPSMAGGNNYWPPAYSPRTRLMYIPSWSVCSEVTLDQDSITKGIFFSQKFRSSERNESDMVAADPTTGEIKKKVHVTYPNVAGTLATAGGLVFTGLSDGSFIALDDTTLDQVWKINVGTGFNAPPMSFEAGGKQYVAILSGISAITKTKHVLTPELREMRNQTMLFVFGL